MKHETNQGPDPTLDNAPQPNVMQKEELLKHITKLMSSSRSRKSTLYKEEKMKIHKYTVLMLVVFFIYGCKTEKNHLETRTESIAIEIQLSPETNENDGSHNKVYGTVEILNITDQAQNYGNSFLFLVVNDTLSSRTYKDTKTSEFIDFSYIQIAPNASISFSAYWIFDAGKNIKANRLQVVFDKNKLDDHIKSSTSNPYNRPFN